MNYCFVRRVTSSIIASLFSLIFGIGSAKSVDAQDTKRLSFCQENKSLFHLNQGVERKLTVAILDFQQMFFVVDSITGIKIPTIETAGLGNILESKLVNNNQFAVVKFEKIKSLSLEQLRKIRDQNGIEAIIIVTVINFDSIKINEGGWLLTKEKINQEVNISLNLQVVDTTTGEIVLEAQGNGNESGNRSIEVKLPFSVDITYGTGSKYDSYNQIKNNSIEYSIAFRLGESSQTTTIYKNTNRIQEKLVLLATEKAMKEISNKLNNRSEELTCLLRKPTVIADINGSQVVLNKGKLHGYCKEMIFSIERSPQTIIDPATGRIISMKTEKVGTIKLSEVDAQSSVGVGITEPGKSFQVKDIAKLTNDANCPEPQDENNSNAA
ncbi:MAG: CsgG/HfaB family protein [Rivularia sp. (in: cyanobacteria)]